MLQLQQFTFNAFQENTYVMWGDKRKAIIIDPGCYEKSEQQELVDFIQKEELEVEAVINTHCHIDHVLGNAFVKNFFKVPLIVPKNEVETLHSVKAYAPVYGFPLYQECEPDSLLDEDLFTWGDDNTFQVLFVPGHSPGHVAFYHAPSRICINGDVLFKGSIGRTDLPGGDHELLIDSITNTMFALPDETVLYCGHGPETTIGSEKKFNPFVGIQPGK